MNVASEQPTNGKAKAPAAVTAVLSIAVSIIDPSPTQPRKTFTGIEEMADDIKLHGILQPVLLRPHPKVAGRYELVFGERRFRGTKLAGLTHILAIVRDLSDQEVLEIQIVENSKRADIHPLEEADGYRALHETYKLSVEDIAAKVGKSTATVYARLKFCALIPEARKAFLEDRLNAATALLVARVPHEDLQKQALKEVTTLDYRKELPSVREATRIVQEKFMLRLVDAPFDRAGVVVAGVPSCQACPKRTGNQRELFSDVEAKDDLCTDPKCFGVKRDAAWEKKVAEAKEKGRQVLSTKETKDVFPHGSAYVSGTCAYVDLGEKSYDGGKEKLNRTRLGKTELPITIARDPNGGIRELVARKDFDKVVRTEAKANPPATTKSDEAWMKSQEAERKQRAKAKAKRTAEIAELATKAEKRQPTDAFWRTLALAVVRDQDFMCDDALERRGVVLEDHASTDREPVAAALVDTLTGAQARGLVVELLAGSSMSESNLVDFRALYGGATAKSKAKAKKPVAKAPKKKGKARR